MKYKAGDVIRLNSNPNSGRIQVVDILLDVLVGHDPPYYTLFSIEYSKENFPCSFVDKHTHFDKKYIRDKKLERILK
jgi:hypothetical protein